MTQYGSGNYAITVEAGKVISVSVTDSRNKKDLHDYRWNDQNRVSGKMTWIELIYSLPFILMGGCIFSFADVVADRLPRKISFVKGRSYCPSCDHTLAWYDMIPVVSWLLLRGKCRQCRCRIPG